MIYNILIGDIAKYKISAENRKNAIEIAMERWRERNPEIISEESNENKTYHYETFCNGIKLAKTITVKAETEAEAEKAATEILSDYLQEVRQLIDVEFSVKLAEKED